MDERNIISAQLNRIQDSSTASALSKVYHMNGICGSTNEKVDAYLNDYWHEHVTLAQVGAGPLDNTDFLRMLKRCIRLRTRSLNTVYQNARLSLLRRVINGDYNALAETVEFRVTKVGEVLDKQSLKVDLQFEDGSIVRFPVHNPMLSEEVGDISAVIAPPLPGAPPPVPNAIPQLVANNTPIDIELTVYIATHTGEKGDALTVNDSIGGDLAHFRELLKLKRLYLLVKYLPAHYIDEFKNVEVGDVKPKAAWASDTITQKLWNSKLVPMLENLVHYRQQQPPSSRTTNKIRKELWNVHRHIQALLNEKGIEIKIARFRTENVGGVDTVVRQKRRDTVSTVAFPYYTRRTFHKRFNNDDVLRVILQDRDAVPFPTGDDTRNKFADDYRTKLACELPFQNRDVRQAIHSEYRDAAVAAAGAAAGAVAGDDVDIPTQAFFDRLASPVPAQDINFRILPQMIRAMSMQMDLFSDATWNMMREDSPDDFDPSYVQKCSSVQSDDDDPMFANASNIYGVMPPEVVGYTRVSADRQTLLTKCMDEYGKKLDKCNSIVTRFYIFLYTLTTQIDFGFAGPPYYVFNIEHSFEQVMDRLLTPAPPGGHRWTLRIPRAALLGYRTPGANGNHDIINDILHDIIRTVVPGLPAQYPTVNSFLHYFVSLAPVPAVGGGGPLLQPVHARHPGCEDLRPYAASIRNMIDRLSDNPPNSQSVRSLIAPHTVGLAQLNLPVPDAYNPIVVGFQTLKGVLNLVARTDRKDIDRVMEKYM